MDKNRNSGPSAKPGLAVRIAASVLLTRVVDDSRNLDALTDRSHGIKEYSDLSQRDQGLARAIVVTSLRNRNRIEAVLKKLFDRPPPCLLYTSPSPRDKRQSRMPSSA